jgi:hypothetical protein
VAPTGWGPFATAAALVGLDRVDAALRRGKSTKSSAKKGGMRGGTIIRDKLYQIYLKTREEAQTELNIKLDMVSKPSIYNQKNIDNIDNRINELIKEFKNMENLYQKGTEKEVLKFLQDNYPYSLQSSIGSGQNITNFSNPAMSNQTLIPNMKQSSVKTYR